MNEPETMLEMLGGRADAARAGDHESRAGSHASRAGDHQSRTLAVVGLSGNPVRASYSVSAFMQRQGYRIVPVNPEVDNVLGERSYASLSELPERPDVVNVFRLPRYIPAIVDEMIALGLRDLWVQLGIRNAEAAERAERHGIRVVMDRCILIEYQRLMRS